MQWYQYIHQPKGAGLSSLSLMGFFFLCAFHSVPARSQAFNTPWICEAQPDSLSHVWFRQTYLFSGRPRQASITVTTTGYYKLYINACNVGTARYYPQRNSANDHRSLAMTFDVTPYLRADTNVVALVYSPTAPSLHRRQIAVTFFGTSHNGEAFSYDSDGNWQCRKANSRLTTDGGEWIDGRAHNTDWKTTAYAAALWQSANSVANDSLSTGDMADDSALTAYPLCYEAPTITHVVSFPYPGGRGRELRQTLSDGFYGFATATLRGARQGEQIQLGPLTYICNGEMDEQAWPVFATTYAGNIIVEGDDRFRPDQITMLEAVSINKHITDLY